MLAAVAICGASIACANPPNKCEVSPIGNLDLNSADKGFDIAFCGRSSAAVCAVRRRNLHDLIFRLSQDTRIPNVATAAYIVATVYVETGSNNYAPSTLEVIGPDQRKRPYYPLYIGRGWVQLTYKDKYQRAASELHDFLIARKLNPDLVADPQTVTVPDVSYEILVRSMLEGWLEQYRTSASGGADGQKIPTRLGDFITATSVNYGQARAVINGNWIGPRPIQDIMMGPGEYLPDAQHLDAGIHAADVAVAAESYICRIQEK